MSPMARFPTSRGGRALKKSEWGWRDSCSDFALLSGDDPKPDDGQDLPMIEFELFLETLDKAPAERASFLA